MNINETDNLLLKLAKRDVQTLKDHSRSGEAEYTPAAWTKSGNVD